MRPIEMIEEQIRREEEAKKSREEATRRDILYGLNDLIAEAERKGMWLYPGYDGLRFTPQELREENAKGNFIWGATNWRVEKPRGTTYKGTVAK